MKNLPMLLVLFLWGHMLWGQQRPEPLKVKESERTYINVNPDPNGTPWIAGGVRPLSQAEKEKQLALPRFTAKSNYRALPSRVNNAERPAFRPIFAQVGNCCAQASGVAYNFTYEMNLLWGTAANTPATQFPSHFTWNFLNEGKDYGSWYFDGWDIIIDNGCPTVADFGSLDANDNHTFWMSGYGKYKNGMVNNILEYKTIRVNTIQGINDLRQWMHDHGRGDAAGGLANFSALSSGYTMNVIPNGAHEAGKSILTSWGTGGAHAMTFVGYDDDVCWDYNGDGQYTNDKDINNDGKIDLKDWERGALIIANTWGDSWEDGGFCYFPFRMCAFDENEGGLQNSQLVHILNVVDKPAPSLTLKVVLKHSNRGSMSLKVGISSDPSAQSPSVVKELEIFNRKGGEHPLNGNIKPGNSDFEFGLDISEFASEIVDNKARVFFELSSWEAIGELVSLSVVDYRNGEKEYHSLQNGTVLRDGENWFSVEIKNTSTPAIVALSNTMKETVDNDGTVGGTQLMLENTTLSLTNTVLTAGTHYNASGVPQGLALQLKATDNKTIELSFSGKANLHEKSNSTEVQIQLLDAVFSGNKASDISGSEQKLSVVFIDEYTTEYVNLGDFEVDAKNQFQFFTLETANTEYGGWRIKDAGYPKLVLKLEAYDKEVFCHKGTNNAVALNYGDEIGPQSNWFTFERYPDQPNIYSTDYTDWAGKQAYIGVKFAAYTGFYYGWISVSVSADGQSMIFHDAAYYTKPEASIKAGQANKAMLKFGTTRMDEDIVNNNGSIEKAVSAKLMNTAFSVTPNTVLQKGVHYTIGALPIGLSEEIVVKENSYLQIMLNGYAELHNKQNSTSFSIQFTDALFSDLPVGSIDKAANVEIGIHFIDDYKVVYNDMEDMVTTPTKVWNAFWLGDTQFGVYYNNGVMMFETYKKEAVGVKGTLLGKALTKGTEIGLESDAWIFPQDNPNLVHLAYSGYTEWLGKDAYIGLKVDNNGYPCHAWVRLEMNNDGTSCTIKEWAYNEKPYSSIMAGETTFQEIVKLSTSDAVFTESYKNDGALTGTAFVNILNDEFKLKKESVLVQGTNYSIRDLPAGLRCTLKVVNDNQLSVVLSGKAINHTKDNNSTFSISLKDNVFAVSTASTVQGNDLKFNLDFKEPWDIIYTDMADVTTSAAKPFYWFSTGIGEGFAAWWYNKEECIKLETYGNFLVCETGTINLKAFEEGELIGENTQEWYQADGYATQPNLSAPGFTSWEGKEAYMGMCLTNGEYYHYGWMRIALAADKKSYTILDYAYNDQPGAPILAGQKATLSTPVLDATRNLFKESYTNNGTITGVNYLVVTNGKFNLQSGEYQAGTHYSVTGLPSGLVVKILPLNGDTLKVTIEGNAASHMVDNNGSFTIGLKDAAFTNGDASVVKFASQSFSLSYRNPYQVVYVDNDDIDCSSSNDFTYLEIFPNFQGIGAWCYNWDKLKIETYDAFTSCLPDSKNISLLTENTLIDESLVAWTSYDDFPNQPDLCNNSYTAWKGKEGYVGLRFSDAGHFFYAWLRVSVAADGRSFKVLDYAYNEEPDKPIFAGAKIYRKILPVPAFICSAQEVAKNEKVQFTDLSQKNPVAWKWDFPGGNPQSSVEKNPLITYDNTGIFNVTLTVSNADGDSSKTVNQYISVFEKASPIAQFRFESGSVMAGESVQFSDASLRLPTSWHWEFEGGAPAVSSEQNPLVRYNSEGLFSVKLVVENAQGLSQKIQEACIQVTKFSTDGYCAAKNVYGTESSPNWIPITRVQLESIDNSSEISEYSDFTQCKAALTQGGSYEATIKYGNNWSSNGVFVWIDWNQDKQFSNDEMVHGANNTDLDGLDQFTLSVPAGAAEGFTLMRIRTAYSTSSSPCGTVNYAGEVEDYTIQVTKVVQPTASFIADKQLIKVGDKVLFTNTTAGEVSDIQWTFEGGDVAQSNSENVYVQYNNAGRYKVSLTATNANGANTKSVDAFITVTETEQLPVPSFAAQSTNVKGGEGVRFINMTQFVEGASYHWTFEGGVPAESDQMNPEVQYFYQGAYGVALTISKDGKSEQLSKENYILVTEEHKPVADFSSSKTNILANTSVTFTDRSTNLPQSWKWSFEGGNPAESSVQNPVVSYAASGIYKVTLIVENALGIDTLIREDFITVNEFSASGYCEAKHVYNGNWLEIKKVKLGTISNASGLSEYSDFTSQCTELNPGKDYSMEIEYGNYYSPNAIFVWIDWNQDKEFSESELVHSADNADGDGLERFTLSVPADAVGGYTLMRLRSAYSNSCSPCGTINYAGETEDYSIKVIPASVNYFVSFNASNTEVEKGKSVFFVNQSEKGAIAYQWTFEGGTPEQSTEVNPIVKYNTAGTYAVTLEAQYAGGSKITTKAAFINVIDAIVNHAPQGILLSNNSITENAAINAEVGQFSAVDEDQDDTHTFALSAGNGTNDAQNDYFAIEGKTLILKKALDYETLNKCNINVECTDSKGEKVKVAFVINVLDVYENQAPTAIALSPASINENEEAPAIVGTLTATDADADETHNFSLVSGNGTNDAHNSLFNIENNKLVAKQAFDFETTPVLNVFVQVKDKANNEFSQAIIINVNDVFENSVPTDILLSSNAVSENADAGLLVATLSASDADAGESFVFSMASSGQIPNEHNGLFSINGNELITNAVFDYETTPQLHICIKVTDSHGGSFTKGFTIAVNDVDENNRPTDILLSKYVVLSNTAVGEEVAQLSAVDADENDEHSFRLYPANGVLDADNGKFSISGNILSLNADISAISGKLNIYVRTQDKSGAYLDKALSISVVQEIVNHAPTGISVDVSEFSEWLNVGDVVANLLVSDEDADDKHVFTLVENSQFPDNGTFVIQGSTIKLAKEVAYSVKSDYSIRVKAQDLAGESVVNNLSLQVKDEGKNFAPANILLSSTSVSEHAPVGTLIGTLLAVDSDMDDEHVFTLVANVSDNAVFQINDNKLVTKQLLDFETKSEYMVSIKVTDLGGLSFTKEFTILVNDEAENSAPTDIKLSNSMVEETAAIGTVIGNFSVVDADADDIHSFEFAEGAADNINFIIEADALKLNATLNYDEKPSFLIRVKAIDQAGAYVEKDFAINVKNIGGNSSPVDILLSKTTIDENLASGSLIGLFSAVDADENDSHVFMLASGGNDNASFRVEDNKLVSNQVFDFEVKANYSIKVRVLDATNAEFTKDFVITVNDVFENSSPTDIQLSSLNVDENVFAGTVVGTLSVTDADAGDSHSYSFADGGTDNAMFLIAGNVLKINTSPDYESKPSYSIKIKVKDASNAEFTKDFDISVNDLKENNAPTDIQLSSLKVDENVVAGTIIGTLSAADADAGDNHTFSFASGGVDNSSFVITGNELKITVSPDYETKPSYSIKIKVKDASNAEFTKDFAISVNDLKENNAPTDIQLSSLKVDENVVSGTVIGILSAIDADAGDSHTFSFASGGADNSSFAIEGNELKITVSPDYEVKLSYSIKINVKDASNAEFTKDFVITVNDMNENNAPTDIQLSCLQIAETAEVGTVIGRLSAIDSDSDDLHSFDFAQQGNDDDVFAISGDSLILNKPLNYALKSSYAITIEVADNAGATFIKQFVITVILGVEDYKAEQIKVYPNPVKDILKIDAKNVEIIELFDSKGQLMYQLCPVTQNEELSINFIAMEEGIYILRLTSKTHQSTNRIIIKQ